MNYDRNFMNFFRYASLSLPFFLLPGHLAAQQAGQGNGRAMDPDKARVIDYWTQDRRGNAVPRDLVIDQQGTGYLRRADGSLVPYGNQLTAEEAPRGQAPQAAPGSNNDTTPPSIGNMSPGQGDVTGDSATFSAVVTDDSGIRSVTFTIIYPDSVTTQSFSANAGANDTWSITLHGFTDGSWSWTVDARDTAKRGGNRATAGPVDFTVDTGSGGGSGGSGSTDTEPSAEWTYGGAIQTAAGRIYFEMPRNQMRNGPWIGYVCSGTAITDDTTGRSIILTAAHCVYDDANKAFARNVLFIPDQADTSGSGTDLNCNNDPLGCWVPSFGVVDVNWTTRTFPDNIPWDYAYYVVSDSGAHAGTSTTDALDAAAGTLSINFSTPATYDGVPGSGSVDFTHALGYSYSEDPKFMFCAEDIITEGSYNWWLPSCQLTGGSSGGPWVQPMDLATGSGPVISVNSWGYTNSPGMAGPKLSGTSAECVFVMAKMLDWSAITYQDGDAGWAQVCP